MSSLIRPKKIPINQIQADIGIPRNLLMKKEIEKKKIDECRKNIKNGIEPHVGLIFDNENKVYWLWDGFPTYKCYQEDGIQEIPANITDGNKHKAQRLSLGASKKDERPYGAPTKILRIILKLPEWNKKDEPDIKIAKLLGLGSDDDDRYYVWKIRNEVEGSNTVSVFRNKISLGEALKKQIFSKENDEFQPFIVDNHKTIFGEKALYIDTKHKRQKTIFGERLPDGLLFGRSDNNKPYFYIVEVELKKHNFNKETERQIEDYFHLYESNGRHLADFIYNKLCSENIAWQKELETLFNADNLYENFYEPLRETIDQSRKLIIIIDGIKEELETKIKKDKQWNKNIKRYIIHHYYEDNNSIIVVEPSFQVEE